MQASRFIKLDDAANDDYASIGQESRRDCHFLHLLYCADGRLLGRVCSNDHSTHNAVEAADLANEAQAFLEEDSG